MFRRAVAIVLIAAALIGVLLFSQWRDEPLKVSGFIEADEIRLGSRVGGRVREVHVEEGRRVTPGEVLIHLDPFDLRERRAEAEARWREQVARHRKLSTGFRQEEIAEAAARHRQLAAELEKLVNGPRPQEIDTARAELAQARASLELARDTYLRAEGLHAKQAISREQFDRAEKELEAAQAQVDARQEQLDLLLEGTRPEDIAAARARVEEAEAAWNLRQHGFREEEIEEAYAAMQAAQSAVSAIDQQLQELEIIAPVAGTVQAVELEPGDLVNANAPVISLLDTSQLWVRAYVPEDELDLSLGQRVKVTVDSYPHERFSGEITFIARQAEFTPRNIQTPEERSQQVFRIKVGLLEGLDRLRPGMAADVWLEEP